MVITKVTVKSYSSSINYDPPCTCKTGTCGISHQ